MDVRCICADGSCVLFHFPHPHLFGFEPYFLCEIYHCPQWSVLLLLSLGISLLPRKWFQVAALVLFALANVSTIRNVYTQSFNPPMDRAAEYLKQDVQPGDPIITSELLSMGPAVYYLPQAAHYNVKSIAGDLVEQQLKIPFAPDLHKDQDIDNLLSTHPSLWYVTCSNGLTKSIGADTQFSFLRTHAFASRWICSTMTSLGAGFSR